MNYISFLSSLLTASLALQTHAELLFSEDFEHGLNQWELRGERAINIIEGDHAHGKVLKMDSEGTVYALIKGSDKWASVAITGEFLFPDDADNYLGFIYNQTENKYRNDFGSVYIKGNDSYIRVNPFRDGNASRLLYEEYKTPLTGDSKIITGKWHQFKLEVRDHRCHLYVDDMSLPKITFLLYEKNAGKLGFQTRVVGYPVWLDNIKVNKIKDFTYQGRPIPDIAYDTTHIITNWEYAGPFNKPIRKIEETNVALQSASKIIDKKYQWKPIRTDARGTLVTARVTEYEGDRELAYFRTAIYSDQAKEVILHFSTTDELGLYVNGLFQGFIYRQSYGPGAGSDWNAWYDFNKNEAHEGTKVAVRLKSGVNYIMLKVRNGQFACGGFFMAIE
ncbi:MAG: hypothetical protein IPJ74_13020 [Saprospiraceae bacterium]|nr:hypothetical protein [Saprospiraceae bacterium]